MTRQTQTALALAICPFYRGFAFAAFKSPLSPIDWGFKVRGGPQKVARSLEAAKHLIDRLQPTAIILESMADPRYHRGAHVQQLQLLIANYATWQSIEVHAFTRGEIRECFKATGARTRHEIAQVIAAQIDVLRDRLPPPRKKWMSEDKRIRLFNAAALALTFYRQVGAVISPYDVTAT